MSMSALLLFMIGFVAAGSVFGQGIPDNLLLGVSGQTYAQLPAGDANPRAYSGSFSVKDFGARGDGTSDDYVAINNAIKQSCSVGGGSIVFPVGIYKHTRTINIQCDNIWLVGVSAAVLDFQPTAPYVPGINDRQIIVGMGYSSGGTNGGNRPIASAIPFGSTSFVAAKPSDTADLAPGNWLNIVESDSGLKDAVAFDWAQVASVTGSTVYLMRPIQTLFPNTHGSGNLYFNRLTTGSTVSSPSSVIENAGVIGLTLENDMNATIGPTVAVMWARGVWIERNVMTSPLNPGPYCFRSSDVHFIGNRIVGTRNQVNGAELAESVDWWVDSNAWESPGTESGSANILIDMASARFNFNNNIIEHAHNIGLQITNGVHDGVVSGNIIGLIAGASSPHLGILASGAQNVLIANNQILGSPPEKSEGTGISVVSATDAPMAVPIASKGNIVVFNRVINFPTPYFVPNAGDLLIADSVDGGLKINHGLSIGDGSVLATSNQTGKGNIVLAVSPELTTPSIGGGSAINALLLKTGRLSFTTILPESCQEQTLTIAGARITGIASASPTMSFGDVNLTWSARVSATNTVSVRLCNSTERDVALGVTTWNISVIQ